MIVLRLNVALPAAVTSFFESHTSLALTRFRRFSQVFPKKTVRQQFVQRGLEFGFGILTLLVAVFDQRPHEWALSERHDPVRAHEPHSVCQIEFQTAVVGDVKRLVAEVGNEIVARDVFTADELVHFFQGGADKAGFHRQMFGTERICRVIAHRIHVERIDFGLCQKSEIADRKTECLARGAQRVRVQITQVGNWFFQSVVGQSGVVGFGEPPNHVAEPSPDPRLDHEEHVRVGDQVQFDLSHFQGHLTGQAGEGGEVKAVEAVRSQHGLSKSLETVGQKKNVRRHVKVVVLFESRHFMSRPYVLGVSIVPV